LLPEKEEVIESFRRNRRKHASKIRDEVLALKKVGQRGKVQESRLLLKERSRELSNPNLQGGESSKRRRRKKRKKNNRIEMILMARSWKSNHQILILSLVKEKRGLPSERGARGG